MKLTQLLLGTALMFTLFSCGKSSEGDGKDTSGVKNDSAMAVTYTVDTAASVVVWKGNMGGKMVYSHWGNVKFSDGTLSLSGNAVTGGSFTVDLKTILPLDSGYTKDKTPQALVGHLSAKDFFLVDSFPTAKFVIKSVEGNTATGDLTVRGVTNEEKATIESVEVKDGVATVKAKLTFDRTKYGVSFVHPVKEFLLSNDIELTVNVTAKK